MSQIIKIYHMYLTCVVPLSYAQCPGMVFSVCDCHIFHHTCWNMNTDVNVKPKLVGCETVTNYSTILFVNVAEYVIKLMR